VRLPRILGPVFLAEVPRRVRAEIALAIPDRSRRRRFAWRQIATFARAPFSLTRIAARARLIGIHDHSADCARILAPTLVVTGEVSLDHVVSAEGTSEYLRLIRHASAVRLEQTGHLGYITRPHEFADTVREFLASNSVDEGGPSTGASRVLSRDGRLSASKNDAA
jgi:pimeloyl-ACP methyl ester carboxylesterase